jgi:hypothetical protein
MFHRIQKYKVSLVKIVAKTSNNEKDVYKQIFGFFRKKKFEKPQKMSLNHHTMLRHLKLYQILPALISNYPFYLKYAPVTVFSVFDLGQTFSIDAQTITLKYENFFL